MVNFIRFSVCIIFTCLLTSQAKSQSKIQGRLQAQEQKLVDISGASILLLKASDSVLVKGTVSNSSGKFSFDNIQKGKYLLHCSHTGYTEMYIDLSDLSKDTDLGVITLKPVAENLGTVVVTGKRPMFEQKIDRMLINVKNSATSAGGTVLDVLEKSPGVIVNRGTGAVSLNGKDGVMVMINGKLSYIPQEAILQMLNGINSSNVERIEIITVPPAKYDAGGNAGYINIVLLSNPDEGFNGSYTLSMGVYKGNFPTASVNFNYRKKQVNFYGGYTFSKDEQLQRFENFRKITSANSTKESKMISERDPFQRNHNARLGVDYNIGKKTILGALVSGYDNKWSMTAKNTAVYSTNSSVDTSVVIDNSEINNWKNLMGNINLQHNVKAGVEFTINADYLYYYNRNPTDYFNQYYNGSGSFLGDEKTTSGKTTIIKLFVAQFDYSKKFNESIAIQWGVKGVSSRFTNDVLVAKLVQNTWEPDGRFTANYFLKESIGAAYVSMDKRINAKTEMKAGLRYEYTESNLGSETKPNIVDRKYGNLFPTFYINHRMNENNSINFSYNRRINRPTFNQLAPFLIFFDPKTFISGSPAVQPSFTDAVKVDYTLKKVLFSVSYSYEKNSIARFLAETNPVDNSQIITAQNLNYMNLFFVSVSFPLKITKWWNSQLNVSGNRSEIAAIINKQKAGFSQVFVNISGSQQFTLPKQFSVELSGFFQSKSFVFGADVVKPYGLMNIALQKKWKDNSQSLVLGVDNVFNSFRFRTSLAVPGQNIESRGDYLFTQRWYKISWTQRFGNKVLKDKRSRNTASDEERKRVD
ncbi:outer membrane beta-barrel family protein [Lacibacter sediminis]|uniref:TonB-dependent receptor n=1 Tax=Lacibacter sediminis TaxID=2760713 RepID=A0A7G5XL80_9BACT|nr:outer membrane beta-barrel family protein [Lacibacter sediminis]QNA46233.1 TonB-dependent receptor [Lacibacter sediminis]